MPGTAPTECSRDKNGALPSLDTIEGFAVDISVLSSLTALLMSRAAGGVSAEVFLREKEGRIIRLGETAYRLSLSEEGPRRVATLRPYTFVSPELSSTIDDGACRTVLHGEDPVARGVFDLIGEMRDGKSLSQVLLENR